MQALLLSPATRFSPDSSSSSPSSPATPPPPSLDFLLMTDSPLGQFDTPTRVTPQQSTLAHRDPAAVAEPNPPATPSWLRPELDEEWREPDGASHASEGHDAMPTDHSTASTTFNLLSSASVGSSTVVPRDHTLRPASPPPPSSSSSTSTSALSTPTRAPLPDAAYASLPKTQPRIPTSLRHAFTASTASTATATSVLDPDGTRDMSVVDHEYDASGGSVILRGDGVDDSEANDDSVGSAGTCVVNSIVERSGGGGGAQDEGGQLAAAVRALRGPNAGLFSAPPAGGEAAASEGGEDGREEAAPRSKVGLLGLFEPPSPPVHAPSLLPPTHAAPSLPLFTFSPPNPVPRTSWKSLPLLSPSPSPPRTDNDATPVAARSSTRASNLSAARLETPHAHAPVGNATPAHRAGGAGPAPTGPGRRDRFLKRSAPASASAHEPEREIEPEQSEAHESSDDAPFVPPPHTGATTTSESDDASEDDASSEEEQEGSGGHGDLADALGLAGPGQPGLGWSSDEDEADDEGRSSFARDGDVSPASHRSSVPALPSPPAGHSSVHLGLPLPPSPRALPASPARIPFPSPALSSVGNAAALPPPPSPLRLFQPTYDTLTRAHLAQLVDDIDDLADNRETYLREGAPPPRHLSPRAGAGAGAAEHDTSDEGFLGDEGEKRSAKRIRLSPRSEREQARFGNLSILSEEPSEFAPADGDDENDSSLALRATPSHRRRSRTRTDKSTSPVSARSRRSMTPALRRARAYTPSASTSALRSSGLDLPSLPALLPAPDSARSRGSSASGASSAGVESPRSPGGGARSREARMDEANAVMERIRVRVEEREARRLGSERSAEQEDEPSPASTARPRFARVRSTTPPSSPPALRNFVPGPSASTPEPAYFASAASASLRSVLSSPAPLASSSSFAPAHAHLAPAPGSPSLALGLPPSVRAAKERGGSLGRRHFARTPIGASDKKRSGEGGAGRDGSGRTQGQDSLLKRTQARRLFGTDADDAVAARASAPGVVGQGRPEQPEHVATAASGAVSPTEPSAASFPPPSSSAARSRGHARHPSLTTLNPASRDTQLLLASAGASAREKGLVFDAGKGRWIRTPRRVAAQAALVEEEQEEAAAVAAAAGDEDDEDPFRDFSELRSANGSGVAAAPSLDVAAAAADVADSIDLDALPRAGDGSLPRDAPVDDPHVTRRSRSRSRASAAALDLSGLGITKGTPPLPAPTDPSAAEAAPQPSPAGACYFEGPPVEERPVEEDAAGPQLVLESEDSATWGRGGAQDKRREAERLFDNAVEVESGAGDAVEESEDDPLAESSMLGLYAAAHAAPGSSSAEVTTEVIVPPSPAGRVGQGVSPATPAGTSRASRRPADAVSAPPVPRSALKPTRAQSAPSAIGEAVAGMSTPLRYTPEPPRVPRSVSFSDGKTSGKIEGLVAVGSGPGLSTALGPLGSRLKYELGRESIGGGPDASSAGEGEGPGSLEFDEASETQSEDDEGQEDADRTVTQETVGAEEGRSTRTSGIDAALRSLARGPDDASPGTHFSRNPLGTSATSSAASCSPAWTRSRAGSRTFTRSHSQSNNATFLTECSFAVSRDRLVQYITDVEPFEPDWAGLRSIDLSGKKADSVVRMREFLPKLDEVNLNDNELCYLTGIPKTLRTLLVASNHLTSLTSFQHLANLERLDLSDNHLDSVHQLSGLRHLRELKLDGNQLDSLDGLNGLDSLVKLSLRSNVLTHVDLGQTTWSRLETLRLSRNKLVNVEGAERLVSLTTLDLDHNRLATFAPRRSLPRLRVLRLGNNPLSGLDVGFAPKLRTLYVDSARLGDLVGTDQLRKLENLSVRDQSGDALTIPMAHVRDVKRFYLSGNPLPSSFPSEKFYNLTYLELAMCQLESLPADFAAVVPNVRVLNLDHNFIRDISPLSGLVRLTKLSLVGARVAKARPLAAVLATLTELEAIDMRMNPFTLAFYPPLVPPSDSLLPSRAEHRILHPDDLPTAVAPASLADPATHSSAWQVLDVKFRRALPDAWYRRRAAYRAVIMQAAPSLARLDGLDCAKERPRLARTVDKLARQTTAAVNR